MKTPKLFLLLFLCVSLFCSCQTKKGTIEDLRELRTELRINGDKYDADDWNEINEKHAEINEELEEFELTEQEAKLVEKLNAEILGYRQKYNIGDAVGGLVNSVAQVIDDATGLHTTSIARSITESSSNKQYHIEKSAKRALWIRAVWISCSMLVVGIFSLFIYLCNTGRSRRAKMSRHTRRSKSR